MKVLHLIDHLGLGGSQQLLLDLLEQRSTGDERRVVALTTRVLPETAERLNRAGVQWSSIDLRRRGPFALLRLRKLLADWRPDLLHTQLDVSNTLGAACALTLRAGRPRILLTLENDPLEHYGRLTRAALKGVASRADGWLVVSESLRRSAAPVLRRARRVEVVEPGIDLERFRPECVRPEDVATLRDGAPLVIGSVGRLSRQKGHDVLIEAMPAVLAAHPGARVIIAGEGPERAALERRARELNVSHAVRLPGYVSDPRSVYAALDIFVAPSRHEGFGIVFQEAMAMGVPVVGTRVVGSRDAVRDGSTGLLVAPEDPGALASGILALAGDAELRARLIAAAMSHVREHGSRRTMAERVQMLYVGLCDQPLRAERAG
jgi:glycosyltransferase involved in cell wall biosynthesis